jgi:uncharacterized SAM-binding protein YcdF (DUF218 family)
VKTLAGYLLILVAGFAAWIWLLAPKTVTGTVVMLVLIGLAAVAMVAVVLPRYRRNSRSEDGTAPELIVHVGGGQTQRTLRQRKAKPVSSPEERNGPIDIHGTG